jgi:TRAP-type C4-dicarboxylate transport system substrate-binding protein
MPITEVYQALQTGQIQASEGEVMQLVSQSTQEVQDYYNITAHFPNGFFLVANVDTYNSLSSEDQELVSEAALAAEQTAFDEITQVEEDLMAELDEGDQIEINRDVNVEAFRELVRPVTEQWLEDNDAELSLEEIEELAP